MTTPVRKDFRGSNRKNSDNWIFRPQLEGRQEEVMIVKARNATSADFEKMAQNHANSFWCWAILSGIIFSLLGGTGLYPRQLEYCLH